MKETVTKMVYTYFANQARGLKEREEDKTIWFMKETKKNHDKYNISLGVSTLLGMHKDYNIPKGITYRDIEESINYLVGEK